MSKVLVGSVESLAPGSVTVVRADERVILVTNLEGELVAIDDTCPHKGGQLSRGTFKDGQVTCPKHGACFDLRTGRNVASAKIVFKSFETPDVRSYPVQVEGADVFVVVE